MWLHIMSTEILTPVYLFIKFSFLLRHLVSVPQIILFEENENYRNIWGIILSTSFLYSDTKSTIIYRRKLTRYTSSEFRIIEIKLQNIK